MTSFAGIHRLGNAQPSHPLATIRRTGVVTDVSGIPNTVTVLVGGDTTTPVDLPYLHSYAPTVGDTVILLAVGADYLVCGSMSGGGVPIVGFMPANGVTDTVGYMTVTHNLGFTPSQVFAQSMISGGTAAINVLCADVYTSTTFRVRFSGVTTAEVARVRWMAYQ